MIKNVEIRLVEVTAIVPRTGLPNPENVALSPDGKRVWRNSVGVKAFALSTTDTGLIPEPILSAKKPRFRRAGCASLAYAGYQSGLQGYSKSET